MIEGKGIFRELQKKGVFVPITDPKAEEKAEEMRKKLQQKSITIVANERTHEVIIREGGETIGVYSNIRNVHRYAKAVMRDYAKKGFRVSGMWIGFRDGVYTYGDLEADAE